MYSDLRAPCRPTESDASSSGRGGFVNAGRQHRYTVLVHDYAGHPFQAELSRELARRGNRVTHAFFAQDAGPKGDLSLRPSDSRNLKFLAVDIGTEYSKTNFLVRRKGDIAYGAAVAAMVDELRPDLVISANTPTEAQEALVAKCRQGAIPFVYWCQDFYSIAVSRLLARRLPVLGHLVGQFYRVLERRQMRRAAHIVQITETFREQTARWGIAPSKVSVIPNWAAVGKLDLRPRNNDWARAQGLGDTPRFVYTGTLGLKHNPDLLSRLATSVEGVGEVVVISAGPGAEYLKSRDREFPALRILPLQPFAVLARVLGAADVLLAVMEREAGTFSVPSKVLSYMCAARPIVLAAPRDNLAAKIVTDSGAGTVVDPEDSDAFAAAALHYARDPVLAEQAGRAARQYAEEHFQIPHIADRFDAVFRLVLKQGASGDRRPCGQGARTTMESMDAR